MNVLVTGCGGDIGQNIGRILAKSGYVKSLIGTDLSHLHYGVFIFEDVIIIPPCNSSKYFTSLEDICRKREIDMIIPTSEPEIKTFWKKGFQYSLKGIPVLMASEMCLEIGFDKLKTVKFLEKFNCPFPHTEILENATFNNNSIIIKSRFGSGSRDVYRVETKKEFNQLKQVYPEFLAQEYLKPDDEEYTCCIFGSESGSIRTIIIRRKLLGDTTGYGIIVKNEQIDGLLLKIAKLIKLTGSINVQLRLTEKGPVIFEINPRFSSTIQFRHLLGFDDLIWSIEDRLGKCIGDYEPVKEGIQMYRGYKYKIVDN